MDSWEIFQEETSNMSTSQLVSNLENVDKIYPVGDQEVTVLKSISTQINEGDFYVIFGPSGSGKSTLLYVILGLEKATNGIASMLNENLGKMDEDVGAQFRKEKIGMVFQQPQWIKSLSVLENVTFPLFLNGKMPSEAYENGLEALKIVGMVDWKDYSPTELSAGQQQRVSLARAIINDPPIIIADEPTGNLDTQAGEELMSLLSVLNKEKGKTVIMVTHDLEYLKFANRVIRIVDGEIANEFKEQQIAALLENLQGKRGTRDIQDLEVEGNKKDQHISFDKAKKDKSKEKESSDAVIKDISDTETQGKSDIKVKTKVDSKTQEESKAMKKLKIEEDPKVVSQQPAKENIIGPCLEYHPELIYKTNKKSKKKGNAK